jgi:hypothetical protein
MAWSSANIKADGTRFVHHYSQRFKENMFRVRFTLLAAALLIASTGCAPSDDIARVEGVVTIDGRPLPNATVVFSNGQSRPSGAITDESGHYELNFRGRQKGAVPGKNKVRITTAQGPSETASGEPVAAVAETIPMIYNVQSTLEFDVEPGRTNTADFQLSSKGKVANY